MFRLLFLLYHPTADDLSGICRPVWLGPGWDAAYAPYLPPPTRIFLPRRRHPRRKRIMNRAVFRRLRARYEPLI